MITEVLGVDEIILGEYIDGEDWPIRRPWRILTLKGWLLERKQKIVGKNGHRNTKRKQRHGG